MPVLEKSRANCRVSFIDVTIIIIYQWNLLLANSYFLSITFNHYSFYFIFFILIFFILHRLIPKLIPLEFTHKTCMFSLVQDTFFIYLKMFSSLKSCPLFPIIGLQRGLSFQSIQTKSLIAIGRSKSTYTIGSLVILERALPVHGSTALCFMICFDYTSLPFYAFRWQRNGLAISLLRWFYRDVYGHHY